MSITPLTTPPTPQNSNPARSMFCWEGQLDFLSSDTAIQNLITFCGNNGVNRLFLDFYSYLGGANWSATHVTQFKKLLHYCHQSGIMCYALAGDPSYPTNQAWFMTNIVRRIMDFNAVGGADTTYDGAKFDGFMLDIEYWTLAGYPGNAAAEVQG